LSTIERLAGSRIVTKISTHGCSGTAHRPRAAALLATGLLGLATAGCLGANSPDDACPDPGDKWYRRAEADFQAADVEEARDSVNKALAVCPANERVRLLSARIALARLDYAQTVKQLRDLPGSEAAGLRGRALWYKGDIDGAADQLELMLNDPEIKDEWAKSIVKLARSGAGRTPFALSGGMLAAVEMPHVSPVAPFFVVPLEIDGEQALALVSTGNAEMVVDSATRQEPSWISVRFGKRLEVSDVPALPQDLSGISKQLGAPIKALIGVNMLRHLNVTLDYTGHQFVVRNFTPPPPPNATRLDLFYVKGGGMVLKSGFADKTARASLLIDTAMTFPVALDQAGWKKAGVDIATLKLVPEDPEKKLRAGEIPTLRLGAYDVPRVPAVYGAPIADLEKLLSQDIDGVVGNGLLAHFRITLGDGGRLMWIEDNAAVMRMMSERDVRVPAPPPAPGEAPSNIAEPPPGPAPAKPAPGSKSAPGSKPAPAPAPAPKGGPAPANKPPGGANPAPAAPTKP
jgi:hypothetical protein